VISVPLYVYGVLSAAAAAAHEGVNGVNGGAVLRLTFGDLAVLVSAAPATPVARTRRNLLAHTAVLERTIPDTTVLPLRFATVAPDEATLATCIEANREAFHAALHDIDGQVELGVKAIWRRGLIFTDIVERDSGLRQLRDRLRSRPPSETYYERIELGRRVEAALSECRGAEANAILDELLPLSQRNAELRLNDDDMVLNRAFLVRRDMEPRFDAAMQALANRFENRMEFGYIGPVPPFNFVTLQAGWLTAATVGA
jgi:hypothetical protein